MGPDATSVIGHPAAPQANVSMSLEVAPSKDEERLVQHNLQMQRTCQSARVTRTCCGARVAQAESDQERPLNLNLNIYIYKHLY